MCRGRIDHKIRYSDWVALIVFFAGISSGHIQRS